LPTHDSMRSTGIAAPDRVAELFDSYQRGDLRAREELVQRFLPLARRLAQRYDAGVDSREDLYQVACFGLVKAIDRFDPEHGTAFTSYAVPTMIGELKRHFRDSSWALRIPRAMQEHVLEVNGAVERLTGRLGTSPTPSQVAAHVGLELETVLDAMQAREAHGTVSLDTPLSVDADGPATLADSIGRLDARLDLAGERLQIAHALKCVPPRERAVLSMRFSEDLTQSEIGERLGISQMHVSRLLRRALERMNVVLSGADASPAATGAERVRRPVKSRPRNLVCGSPARAS
jgi:RNA polymerase sigma-B factor